MELVRGPWSPGAYPLWSLRLKDEGFITDPEFRGTHVSGEFKRRGKTPGYGENVISK